MTSLYVKLKQTFDIEYSKDSKEIKQDKEIFNLLEKIAWKGLQKRQPFFLFKSKKMESIRKEVASPEEENELFFQFCAWGFLQSTEDSEGIFDNEYSFLQLAFQELFA